MEETPPVKSELAALQVQLRLMQELLAAKDRELAAKEESLGLLREKISRREHTVPRAAPTSDVRGGFHFASNLKDPWDGPGGRATRTPIRPQSREEPPKGLWARFYHWFREA